MFETLTTQAWAYKKPVKAKKPKKVKNQGYFQNLPQHLRSRAAAQLYTRIFAFEQC